LAYVSRASSSSPSAAKTRAHSASTSESCAVASRAIFAIAAGQPAALVSPMSATARLRSPAATNISAAAAQSFTSSAHSACRRTSSRVSTVADELAANSFASSHCRRSAKRSIARSTWPARVNAFAASW
jgi:hypothetical protein